MSTDLAVGVLQFVGALVAAVAVLRWQSKRLEWEKDDRALERQQAQRQHLQSIALDAAADWVTAVHQLSHRLVDLHDEKLVAQEGVYGQWLAARARLHLVLGEDLPAVQECDRYLGTQPVESSQWNAWQRELVSHLLPNARVELSERLHLVRGAGPNPVPVEQRAWFKRNRPGRNRPGLPR